MSDFIYFECPECGFDSMQRGDFKGGTACSLCAGDSGHDVGMRSTYLDEASAAVLPAVEGFDARKGTRAEQEKALQAATKRDTSL